MSPFLTQVILHLTATSYAAKHCCYKTTFFSLGCVYQKCLLPRAFNKALLFHPGLSMTMTWFPWDFYGNWLILCNLIKALGVHFFFYKKKKKQWVKVWSIIKDRWFGCHMTSGSQSLYRSTTQRIQAHTHYHCLLTLLIFYSFMDCVVFFPLLP